MIENGSFEFHIYKHEDVINHVKCLICDSNQTGRKNGKSGAKQID